MVMMGSGNLALVRLLLFLVVSLQLLPLLCQGKRRNVLLLIADDLRPELKVTTMISLRLITHFLRYTTFPHHGHHPLDRLPMVVITCTPLTWTG